MTPKQLFGLFFALTLFSISVLPASAVQKLYIANDDHTDYMWTATESTYRSAFREMINYYLDQANSTSGNAPEYQGKFSIDGSFWLWLYEQDQPGRMQELINRIKDGHISVPINGLVNLLGGQSAESVVRNMYYPGRLERQYNMRLPLVIAMENATVPFGVGQLWAGSGAKYTWKGICCPSNVPDVTDRTHEIYWWQGQDDSRVLTKWYSLYDWNHGSYGGYAESRNPLEAVNWLGNYTSATGYPYDIIGAFGKGHDDLKTLTDEFINAAQSRTTGSLKVIVSNSVDFFEDFESTYGGNLPSQSVSFGNEWELFTTHLQEFASRTKRGVEQLRSTEALLSYIYLDNSNASYSFESTRDEAYYDLGFMWEHSGTYAGAVSQSQRVNWLRGVSNNFKSFSDQMYADAQADFPYLIKNGSSTRFYVFNPLSWSRTDYADLLHPGSQSSKVVDVTTGQDVPFQLITKNNQAYVRILASNVPSLGYKTYDIVAGPGTSFPQAGDYANNTLENDFYRLNIANRGAITSLIDKTQSNREFAANINNLVINDLGSTTNGGLVQESVGPVSITVRATSTQPSAHTTRITLYKDVPRIDIDNQITENFGSSQRTWAFSYNLNNPNTNHEEVGAVINARLASNGGHYSNRNAVYKWLTANHFIDQSVSGAGITLSNQDLDYFRLGNSSFGSLDTNTPQVRVAAGGADGSDYPSANQGGESLFTHRFALMPHTGYNQTESMKMALEHQNPFVTGEVKGTGSSPYPEGSHSLLSISNPNVLAWAVKPHEDGINQGLVVRVWNQSNSPESFNLSLGGRAITSAKHITHIETDVIGGDQSVSNGVMQANINQQQIKSYRLLSVVDGNQPTNTPIPPPASPTPNPADFDGDDDVDFLDLLKILTNFNQLNGDYKLIGTGVIDIFDFNKIISFF